MFGRVFAGSLGRGRPLGDMLFLARLRNRDR
jgi:hypothetical protein